MKCVVIKGCRCQQCSRKSIRQWTIKKFARTFRHKSKLALKEGREPPVTIGFGWPG